MGLGQLLTIKLKKQKLSTRYKLTTPYLVLTRMWLVWETATMEESAPPAPASTVSALNRALPTMLAVLVLPCPADCGAAGVAGEGRWARAGVAGEGRWAREGGSFKYLLVSGSGGLVSPPHVAENLRWVTSWLENSKRTLHFGHLGMSLPLWNDLLCCDYDVMLHFDWSLHCFIKLCNLIVCNY